MAKYDHIGTQPIVLEAGEPHEQRILPGTEGFEADLAPELEARLKQTGAIRDSVQTSAQPGPAPQE